MRVMKWLVSAGALMSMTACVAYPTTSYGGYDGYQGGYYGRPAYYQPAPRYVAAPSYRYYRDRNGDGIPDRYQRRNNWGW